MKTLIGLSGGNKFIRLLMYPLFISMLIFFAASCTGGPEPYSIPEFTGKGEVYNYSRSFYPMRYGSDSLLSTALLAGNGDLIVYGEKHLFRYSSSSQNKFSIKTTDSTGFINEKISSICIPGDDDMIPWFKQMKSTDISSLDFLFFDKKITESYIPYLTDLAVVKTGIGIGYDGDLKDMTRVLEILKPGFIIGGYISNRDFGMLSGLNNLELLSVSLSDSLNTTPLPAMPGLKQLILTGIKKNAVTNDDFLINNKQIERLTIAETGKFNLLLIKPLSNLKELIVNVNDTIENFDLIKDHKQLELLSLYFKKLRNDTILRELPGIRWMSFYEESTQDEFNSFVEYHPGLEVVEIMNNREIKSLRPLLKLGKLYGLTISDTLTDFNTVKSLKSLKYLSLPESVLKDSIKKAGLQKLLPDTRIVTNHGVCLGSGWLLLLIPLILVLKLFSYYRIRMFRHNL